MFPLAMLAMGERGEIVEIRGELQRSAASGVCRIEDMGMRIGKQVEMLANAGSGALLLKIDESRVAIARSMAMKILVRRPV